MQINKTLLMTAAIVLAGFSTVVVADSCPTDLKKDDKGFYYSDQKPTWRAHMTLPENVTLDTKNVGGAVFSPKTKRIACVYQASNNKWVALVSEPSSEIQIDKDAKDDSGQGPAWKFDDQRKDYACGKPSVSDINKCVFTFEAATTDQKTDQKTEQESDQQTETKPAE